MIQTYINKIYWKIYSIVNPILNLRYSIGTGKECPICGWKGSGFIKKRDPNKPAPHYMCPKCRSQSRHRFAYYALSEQLEKEKENYTLHVAPEDLISKWLRSISKDYLSIDLMSPAAMKHMDITQLELEDCSFDLIWCSHVLEHIPEDIKAMSELYRVLKPGGKMIIQVPIGGEKTYENPEITDPKDRSKHFWQHNHVRLYGLDIVGSLQKLWF